MPAKIPLVKRYPNYLDNIYDILSKVSENYNEQQQQRALQPVILKSAQIPENFAIPNFARKCVISSDLSPTGEKIQFQLMGRDMPIITPAKIYDAIPRMPMIHPIVIGERRQLYSEDELIKLKGPSRLIGFLVTIAMNEQASRALRWTGNGLEFVLVNRDLVAKMWGNRKHNTKDMDYLKLSRAIREKYEKRDHNGQIIKEGRLSKGARTYSYVFTKNAHNELCRNTNKTIPQILEYARAIGRIYQDSNDTLSPDNRKEI